jgi:hypothetical protein
MSTETSVSTESSAPVGADTLGVSVGEAAAELTRRRRPEDTTAETIEAPVDDEGKEKSLTPREAAKAVGNYREAKAAEKAAVESALGVDSTEPGRRVYSVCWRPRMRETTSGGHSASVAGPEIGSRS